MSSSNLLEIKNSKLIYNSEYVDTSLTRHGQLYKCGRIAILVFSMKNTKIIPRYNSPSGTGIIASFPDDFRPNAAFFMVIQDSNKDVTSVLFYDFNGNHIRPTESDVPMANEQWYGYVAYITK